MATKKPVAAHHDGGKPAVADLDPWFVVEMGRVMSYGRIKYPNDPDGTPNWWKGGSYRSFVASILRHTLALAAGESGDWCPTMRAEGKCSGADAPYCPEHSRLHHAAHIAVDAMFLGSWINRTVGEDDRLTEDS